MPSVVVQGMGRAELLALPAAIDLDTANRAIGLGRSKGYELARLGDYPCRVLRLGKKYRVITADLLRLLGIDAAVGEGVAADAA
ncbi:hypothetical protein [Streptomyces sp. TLI_171]|uniref:hypothetical protein n=1 Tax=Streptomyces sp. TLI_171 TaxID=1938859 RepID=UPI000C1A686A|nr:hypothetical protein [Streptomyces sp. TLI_171]